MVAIAMQDDGLHALGEMIENVSIPSTVSSLSALRFSARLSRRMAISPRVSAWSEEGRVLDADAEPDIAFSDVVENRRFGWHLSPVGSSCPARINYPRMERRHEVIHLHTIAGAGRLRGRSSRSLTAGD